MKKKENIYVKAVKKADREMNLGNGWVAKDRPHANKKKYNRKNLKNVFDE